MKSNLCRILLSVALICTLLCPMAMAKGESCPLHSLLINMIDNFFEDPEELASVPSYCSGHPFSQPLRMLIITVHEDGSSTSEEVTLATIQWRFRCRRDNGRVVDCVPASGYPKVILNQTVKSTYHVQLGQVVAPPIGTTPTSNGYSISIMGGSFVLGYDQIIDYSNPAATDPTITHVTPTFYFQFNGSYTYGPKCQ